MRRQRYLYQNWRRYQSCQVVRRALYLMKRTRNACHFADVGLWSGTLVLLMAFLTLTSQCTTASERGRPAHRVAPQGVSVGVRDGLLSVEANGASSVELLNEVRRVTGIHFYLAKPLEGSITVSFQDVPIERAMKRLFGSDANFIFFYPSAEPRLAAQALPYEVWVVGKEQGGSAQTSGTRSTREELAASAPEDAGNATQEEATQEVTQTFNMNPQAAQELALSSDNPEVRLMAVAYLGQQADPSAVGVLLQIVLDPDPHLRQSALDELIPQLDTNPQVRQGLADVLQAAQDAEVRQQVANVLESTGELSPELATFDSAGNASERERLDAPDPDSSK